MFLAALCFQFQSGGDVNLDVLQKTLSLVTSDALKRAVPVLAPLLLGVIVVRHVLLQDPSQGP
jgi:hypothetical protein